MIVGEMLELEPGMRPPGAIADPRKRLGRVEEQLTAAARTANPLRARVAAYELLSNGSRGAGTLEAGRPARQIAVPGDSLVLVRLGRGLAFKSLQRRPRLAALERNLTDDLHGPVPGARNVAGARGKLVCLASDPFRLEQLAHAAVRIREPEACLDRQRGEDLPVSLGPDRPQSARRLCHLTHPAQRNARRDRRREVRLEIEPAGGRRTRLRTAQHRLGIVLLHCHLVLELQGGEIRAARTDVERAHASGPRRKPVGGGDRLARQRRTLERALLEPESDLAVVGPLLELEHLVGRADLPTSGKEITSVVDAGERVRRPRRLEQRGGTLEGRLGPIRDERPARQRLLVLGEIAGKRGDLLAQLQRLLGERIGVVGDAREEPKSFRAEQLALRRARESQRQVERRQARGPAVLERAPELPQVGPRIELEPFGQPVVQAPSGFLG